MGRDSHGHRKSDTGPSTGHEPDRQYLYNNAIMAACALEQRYSGHTPPWQTDYPPFEFCTDMDALRETVLIHSERFIDVSRWSTTHDFRPLDEIAAIRHEEEDTPEHKQSSPLYLLAIEMRNPWVIVDDAQLDIEKTWRQTCCLSSGICSINGLRSSRFRIGYWITLFHPSEAVLMNSCPYPGTHLPLLLLLSQR